MKHVGAVLVAAFLATSSSMALALGAHVVPGYWAMGWPDSYYEIDRAAPLEVALAGTVYGTLGGGLMMNNFVANAFGLGCTSAPSQEVGRPPTESVQATASRSDFDYFMIYGETPGAPIT